VVPVVQMIVNELHGVEGCRDEGMEGRRDVSRASDQIRAVKQPVASRAARAKRGQTGRAAD
jgi:hypothetical protein